MSGQLSLGLTVNTDKQMKSVSDVLADRLLFISNKLELVNFIIDANPLFFASLPVGVQL